MSRAGTPEQQPPAPGERKTLLGRLASFIFDSALWKSMYMNPYPRDKRTRSLAVLNSL
ncbi:MAG: cytochrome B6, partial [Bacillota bacterium]